METETMGRVVVAARIGSADDLVLARKGLIPADQVRSIAVNNALVDAGASGLSMPRSMIEQLGLDPVRTRTAITSASVVAVTIYGMVRLTVQIVTVSWMSPRFPRMPRLDWPASAGSHGLGR